jgi:hypothetical protein
VSLSHVARLRKWKCLIPTKPGYAVAPGCCCPGVFVSGFLLSVVDVECLTLCSLLASRTRLSPSERGG